MKMSDTTPEQQAAWSLSQWLEYLEQIHHRPIDMGLDRVRAVAQRMDLLSPSGTVFIVAGTNGKGSTVRYLEVICQQAGFTTGTYTSPHLIDYRERVRVNGAELDDAAHAKAFFAVERARGEISLTYFEFGTLAALFLLQQQPIDVLVLEIGLGGRLDAVNIIDGDVAIVTSVGIDHIEFLGPDREGIGFEKAGVYRTGKPAICGDPQPPKRLVEQATAISANLLLCEQDFHVTESADHFTFHGPQGIWDELPYPSLPLVNASTALAALQSSGLAIHINSVRQGLRMATLPGRMEQIREEPTVLLDVGHNPHATTYIAAELVRRFPDRRIVAVCAMLRDKEHADTLKPLCPLVSEWYLGSIEGPRGYAAADLRKALPEGADVTLAVDVEHAFTQAIRAVSANDVVLCFGSFLTVAAIHKIQP